MKNHAAIKNTLRVKRRRTIKVTVLNSLCVAMTLGLLVGYLVMVNSSAMQGYKIRSLEQNIAKLEDNQRKLEVQSVSDQSLNNVQQAAGALGLVPASNVQYLNENSGDVAVK